MHDPRVSASPELRLLFQRSRGSHDFVGARIDWARFFEIAEEANSFPVIWRELSRVPGVNIPADIAQRMQRRAMVAEFTLLNQGKLLEGVLRALADAGIEVMLLKGAALAVSVYGSFANRPMGDVDLLVRPDHATRARDVLVASGWEWHHDPALDDFYAEHCHLPPLYDAKRTGASIELHVDLFPKGHPFAFGAEAVWAARRRAQVGGQGCWIPSAQDLLLHAAIHFAWSHGLRSGAWTTFRDVDALASAGLDWDAFASLARSSNAGTCAYWTLALASGFGAAEVPRSTLEQLAPRVRGGLGALLTRHFVAGLTAPELECPSRRVQRWLWELAIQPGASGHGDARPWMRDDRYGGARGGAGVPEAISSSATGESKARAWSRYLRALVRPR